MLPRVQCNFQRKPDYKCSEEDKQVLLQRPEVLVVQVLPAGAQAWTQPPCSIDLVVKFYKSAIKESFQEATRDRVPEVRTKEVI